jgi:hypothetical protein
MTAKGEKVEHKTIHEAMAAAFAEMPAVPKTRKNSLYGSMYANLDDAYHAIRPVLSKHGLFVVQAGVPCDALDIVRVHTTIHDRFGGMIDCGIWTCPTRPIPKRGEEEKPPNAHSFGSAITYVRRYALCAALGLVDVEDDDGNAAATHGQDHPAKRAVPAKNGKKAEAGATSAMYLAAVKGVSRIEDVADAKQLANDILRRLQIDKAKAGPDDWSKAIGVLERIEKEGVNLFEWVREVEVQK